MGISDEIKGMYHMFCLFGTDCFSSRKLKQLRERDGLRAVIESKYPSHAYRAQADIVNYIWSFIRHVDDCQIGEKLHLNTYRDQPDLLPGATAVIDALTAKSATSTLKPCPTRPSFKRAK
jgi:hypothetical protein